MRSKLSYANVVATLALVLAVMATGGGVAYAHGLIGTSDLLNGAVTTPKLASGAVGTGKIKSGAVKRGKIADRAVNRRKISNGAVNAPKLANGAVTTSKIRAGAGGVAVASARVESQDLLGSSFNRRGGAPHVSIVQDRRHLTFPGLDLDGDSVVLVSSYTWVDSCAADIASGVIRVSCRNVSTGTTTTNTWFYVVVYE